MSFWHNRGRPHVANETSILSHAIRDHKNLMLRHPRSQNTRSLVDALADCCACGADGTAQTLERVRNLISRPLSRENMPPRPGRWLGLAEFDGEFSNATAICGGISGIRLSSCVTLDRERFYPPAPIVLCCCAPANETKDNEREKGHRGKLAAALHRHAAC